MKYYELCNKVKRLATRALKCNHAEIAKVARQPSWQPPCLFTYANAIKCKTGTIHVLLFYYFSQNQQRLFNEVDLSSVAIARPTQTPYESNENVSDFDEWGTSSWIEWKR